MSQQKPYEELWKAPREIRTAANVALVCGGVSRTIGIATSTVIVALLPSWVPGLLALQPLPLSLLILAVGTFLLARVGFRNRERIASRQFEKARASSLLATFTGLVVGGVLPGILYFFLYTRIGHLMVKRRPDDPTTVYLLPQPSEGLFLGRYLGWLAAYFLVLYVGYTQLPAGLGNISNWLSPVMGVHFNTLVVAAYLVFTNPLTYPPLLQLWATAGVLGGLIAGGRVGRGFLVALTVFLSTLGAMGLAALAIARSFSLVTLASIPPPPPGFSLSTVATGPVARDLIPLFLRSNSPTDPAFIRDAVLTLIRNAGLVLAVATISGRGACLAWQGGLFLAKQALKGKRHHSSPAQQVDQPTGGSTVKAGVLFVLALSLLIPFQSINTQMSIPQAPPGGPFQQNLVAGLDTLGAPNASLLLTNLDLSARGLVLDSNYARSNFSIFLVNNNYPQGFGAGPQSFMLRLFSQPVLLTFFPGDLTSNAPSADAIANQFSRALGVSFTFALALPTGQGVAAIYSPDPSLSNSEALNRVLALVPSTSFAGLVNPANVANEKYAMMLGLLPPFKGASVHAFSFMLSIQYPREFFKQGPHLLSFKTLLGFQNSIVADPAANVSLISLTFQKGTILYSSLGPDPYYVNSTSTYYLNATSTPVTDFRANFTYPFAPRIIIQKTLDPSAGTVGSTSTITLKVRNLDNVTVNNLNVTDPQTSSFYLTTLRLTPSGQQTIQLAAFIAGDSKSLSYTASPSSSGTYVLSPATVAFLWTAPNGTAIRYSINSDEAILMSSSGPVTQFSNTFSDLWPYSLALVLALFIAPLWETFRLLRKRSRTRNVSPKPVDSAASPNSHSDSGRPA